VVDIFKKIEEFEYINNFNINGNSILLNLYFKIFLKNLFLYIIIIKLLLNINVDFFILFNKYIHFIKFI
jgi:hypothetical protein